MLPIANSRTVRATSTTLSWQPTDQYGEAANPGTVTVGVTRADGTTLVAAGAATSGATTAPRTYTLSVSQTADMDLLTATWTVSGTTVATTLHEVTSGVYASLTAIRAGDASLASATTYPDATLQAVRSQVERIFEQACGVAFLPRFTVVRLHGTGTSHLSLPVAELRRVRWAKEWDGTSSTDLTAAEIAAIPASRAGVAVRTDGDIWTQGYDYEIGFEHGYDAVPADVQQAAIRAIRRKANELRSSVPDQATSMQLLEGGTVVFASPGVGGRVFGIPDVDEVLKRHNRTIPGIA